MPVDITSDKFKGKLDAPTEKPVSEKTEMVTPSVRKGETGMFGLPKWIIWGGIAIVGILVIRKMMKK